MVLKLGLAQEEYNTVEGLCGGVGEYLDTKSWRSGQRSVNIGILRFFG
jgi:hypothetical protein